MEEAEPTSPGITMRRAVPADASVMRTLARTAYQHYVERVGREPGPMVDDYARRVAEDECWVASTPGSEGRPADVGYLVLRPEPDYLLLDNVAVSPDRQGLGIGTYLLGFAEERARAQGLDEVRLYTHETMTENIALYTRHDYVETHRAVQSGFLRVFMAKRLGQSSTPG